MTRPCCIANPRGYGAKPHYCEDCYEKWAEFGRDMACERAAREEPEPETEPED